MLLAEGEKLLVEEAKLREDMIKDGAEISIGMDRVVIRNLLEIVQRLSEDKDLRAEIERLRERFDPIRDSEEDYQWRCGYMAATDHILSHLNGGRGPGMKEKEETKVFPDGEGTAYWDRIADEEISDTDRQEAIDAD